LHLSPTLTSRLNRVGSKRTDINSAPAHELETLRGIGCACSARIVAGRPYRGRNELVDRNIIPEAIYARIKNRLIAKQK
jgi:DNA uptake protein ComE-like DNA-binding protein